MPRDPLKPVEESLKMSERVISYPSSDSVIKMMAQGSIQSFIWFPRLISALITSHIPIVDDAPLRTFEIDWKRGPGKPHLSVNINYKKCNIYG